MKRPDPLFAACVLAPMGGSLVIAGVVFDQPPLITSGVACLCGAMVALAAMTL
jgi:hypothetical protein